MPEVPWYGGKSFNQRFLKKQYGTLRKIISFLKAEAVILMFTGGVLIYACFCKECYVDSFEIEF